MLRIDLHSGLGGRLIKTHKRSVYFARVLPAQGEMRILTFLDAVFLWPLVIWVLVLSGDALGALVVVVLQWGTLGGFGAFCRVGCQQSVLLQLLSLRWVWPDRMRFSIETEWHRGLRALHPLNANDRAAAIL